MTCSRLLLAIVLVVLMVKSSFSDDPHQLCRTRSCSVCDRFTARCETTSKNNIIPQGLQSTVKNLNVSHQTTRNDSVELTRDLFRKYTALEVLRLHGDFHSIAKDALIDLTELKQLNIVRTKISFIPENLLQYNVKIQIVKFNGNLIEYVPFHAVGEMNNLSVLHFKGNLVDVRFPCTELSESKLAEFFRRFWKPSNESYVRLPDIVEHFDKLQNLSLTALLINSSSCDSNVIPSDFFTPVSDTLTFLDLSESNLLLYNQSSILLPLEQLRNLSLSAALPFRYCPALGEKLLKGLPTSITNLQLLYWENVGVLNDSCLLNVSSLGGLSDLTDLTALSFRNSDFAFGPALHDSSLPFMSSLLYLDLGFCRISYLTSNSLQHLSSLIELNLDGNPLGQQIYVYASEFPPNDIPSVRSLSFRRTGFRSDGLTKFDIEPFTQFFSGVRKLDLSRNSLTQVPAFSATKMMTLNITVLIMNDNELTAFSHAGDNVCARFPALLHLSLAHNRLESVERLCPNLLALNLGYNNLDGDSDVHLMKLIKNQSMLELLDLSDNHFQKFHDDLLYGMKNLRVFRAADIQLAEIHESFFHKNLQLEEIDLSFNFISLITPGMFSPLKHLKTLKLRGSQIARFSADFTTFIDRASTINTLDIQNNPIDCACSQDYFKTWLTTTEKVMDISKLKCSAPEYLVDELVYDYEVNFFDCFVVVPLVVSIVALTSFLLTLLIAVPCYKYRWYLTHIRVVYRAIRDSINNIRLEYVCEYDAYVSYDRTNTEDATWVERSLIPAIEQPGGQMEKPLRLYVDERDALIGVPRFTERTNALQKSRKILIVVSNSYLNSAFCLGEADLSGYVMHGTEFYQPNRVMVLVREELRNEIIRAPMTALLVGNVINADCTGRRQVTMWKRIRNFVKTPQFYYRRNRLVDIELF